MLGALYSQVPVSSLAQASEVAVLAVAAVGADGHDHLGVDIRSDRAVLRLHSAVDGMVTRLDISLARSVTAALTDSGLRLTPGAVQALEIAIDALDIPAVRPFWKAITGYVDEHGPSDLNEGLIDPTGRGPAIWFQQMDAPTAAAQPHPPRYRRTP